MMPVKRRRRRCGGAHACLSEEALQGGNPEEDLSHVQRIAYTRPTTMRSSKKMALLVGMYMDSDSPLFSLSPDIVTAIFSCVEILPKCGGKYVQKNDLIAMERVRYSPKRRGPFVDLGLVTPMGHHSLVFDLQNVSTMYIVDRVGIDGVDLVRAVCGANRGLLEHSRNMGLDWGGNGEATASLSRLLEVWTERGGDEEPRWKGFASAFLRLSVYEGGARATCRTGRLGVFDFDRYIEDGTVRVRWDGIPVDEHCSADGLWVDTREIHLRPYAAGPYWVKPSFSREIRTEAKKDRRQRKQASFEGVSFGTTGKVEFYRSWSMGQGEWAFVPGG
jgi:hypothetical protein